MSRRCAGRGGWSRARGGGPSASCCWSTSSPGARPASCSLPFQLLSLYRRLPRRDEIERLRAAAAAGDGRRHDRRPRRHLPFTAVVDRAAVHRPADAPRGPGPRAGPRRGVAPAAAAAADPSLPRRDRPGPGRARPGAGHAAGPRGAGQADYRADGPGLVQRLLGWLVATTSTDLAGQVAGALPGGHARPGRARRCSSCVAVVAGAAHGRAVRRAAAASDRRALFAGPRRTAAEHRAAADAARGPPGVGRRRPRAPAGRRPRPRGARRARRATRPHGRRGRGRRRAPRCPPAPPTARGGRGLRRHLRTAAGRPPPPTRRCARSTSGCATATARRRAHGGDGAATAPADAAPTSRPTSAARPRRLGGPARAGGGRPSSCWPPLVALAGRRHRHEPARSTPLGAAPDGGRALAEVLRRPRRRVERVATTGGRRRHRRAATRPCSSSAPTCSRPPDRDARQHAAPTWSCCPRRPRSAGRPASARSRGSRRPPTGLPAARGAAGRPRRRGRDLVRRRRHLARRPASGATPTTAGRPSCRAGASTGSW